jgi:hypothetical protein
MTKTLRPVFSPLAEADEVDEADDDVVVELDDEEEHAASRIDAMTMEVASHAVCLSLMLLKSFQCRR